MKVKEIMLGLDHFPVLGSSVILKKALDKMGDLNLGIACIIDDDKKLLGVITDGDIRRKLLNVQKPLSSLFIDDAIDHAIITPVFVGPEESLEYSIELMGEKKIWDLPVVDVNGILVGLLHLHPTVKALLLKLK